VLYQSCFPLFLGRNKDKKCSATRHVIVFIIFWKPGKYFSRSPKLYLLASSDCGLLTNSTCRPRFLLIGVCWLCWSLIQDMQLSVKDAACHPWDINVLSSLEALDLGIFVSYCYFPYEKG